MVLNLANWFYKVILYIKYVHGIHFFGCKNREPEQCLHTQQKLAKQHFGGELCCLKTKIVVFVAADVDFINV